jgi:hypothetical protein
MPGCSDRAIEREVNGGASPGTVRCRPSLLRVQQKDRRETMDDQGKRPGARSWIVPLILGLGLLALILWITNRGETPPEPGPQVRTGPVLPITDEQASAAQSNASQPDPGDAAGN